MKEVPNPIYRITISKENKIFKTFSTIEEAVVFARKMMEADGKHVFMEVKTGSNGTVIKWIDMGGETPKIVSKSVGIANSKEIEAIEKENAEERWIENFGKRWTALRKLYGVE